MEDNGDMADIVRAALVEEGYAVDRSRDGEDGLWRATSVDYDVAVLDINLPGIDGLEILASMRKAGRTTPVLLLTARDRTSDRVAGLDAGADDYLVKPFALGELLARLRALLRRAPSGTDGLLRFGDLEMNPARRTVRRGDREVPLTPKEFEILQVFLRQPARVHTRTEIIEHAWDDSYEGMSNSVDVLLSRMRRKLCAEGESPLLRTVRGVGYSLADTDDA